MIVVEAIKPDKKIEQAFVHYSDAKAFMLKREEEGYSVILHNYPDLKTHEELAEYLKEHGLRSRMNI